MPGSNIIACRVQIYSRKYCPKLQTYSHGICVHSFPMDIQIPQSYSRITVISEVKVGSHWKPSLVYQMAEWLAYLCKLWSISDSRFWTGGNSRYLEWQAYSRIFNKIYPHQFKARPTKEDWVGNRIILRLSMPPPSLAPSLRSLRFTFPS